ncbi:MAG: AAA family ATPase [Planctomycetes bacterium]|nr:AAA family ATPase [Planctomycetota bacterium]MCW8135915.1 AAA family ATPase [Planctomycetota bacterium]
MPDAVHRLNLRMTEGAAAYFLRSVGEVPDAWGAEEQAHSWLQQKLKRTAPHRVYLSRLPEFDERNPDRNLVRVRIPSRCFEIAVSGSTAFKCVPNSHELRVLRTEKSTIGDRAQASERTIETTLTIDDSRAGSGLPQQLYDSLLDEHEILQLCERTEASLARWKGYLSFEKRLAEDREFEVQYHHYHQESGKRRYAFILSEQPDAKDIARISAASKNHREQVYMIHPSDERDEREAAVKGRVIEIRGGSIVVELDAESLEKISRQEAFIPPDGVLFNSARGDLAQVERQHTAVARLVQDDFHLEHGGLADLLFGASDELLLTPASADPPEPQFPYFMRNINLGQKEAVRRALATPDMCLIQGPPGTGKTTVIAELCFQLASAGKRVLVASQANLAVDNALERLFEHPAILAIRDGNPDKFEEGGKKFVGERAVRRWLSSIREKADQNRKRIEDVFANAGFYLREWQAAHALLVVIQSVGESKQRCERSRSALDEFLRKHESEHPVLQHRTELLETLTSELGTLKDAIQRSARVLPAFVPPKELGYWSPSTGRPGGKQDNPWEAGRALSEARRNLESAVLDENALGVLSDMTQRVTRSYHVAEAIRGDMAESQAKLDALRQQQRTLSDELTVWDRQLEAAVWSLPHLATLNVASAANAVEWLERLTSTPNTPWINGQEPRTTFEITLEHFRSSFSAYDAGAVTEAISSIERWFAFWKSRAPKLFAGYFARKRSRYGTAVLQQYAAALAEVRAAETNTETGLGKAIRADLQAARDLAAKRLGKLTVDVDKASLTVVGLEEEFSAATKEQAGVLRGLEEAFYGLRVARMWKASAPDTLRTEGLPHELFLSKVASCGNWVIAERANFERESSSLVQSMSSDLAAIATDLATTKNHLRTLNTRKQELQDEHEEAERNHDHIEAEGARAGREWERMRVSEAVPESVRAIGHPAELALARKRWVEQHGGEERVRRAEAEYQLVSDWVRELGSENASVSSEVTEMFYANANVVGATCMHAAERGFVKRYGADGFDMVIVDEVSKATPTELLIPCLLGKRIVLVGDHKQLPPMLPNDDDYDERAETLGMTKAEVKEMVGTSLFKERYKHFDDNRLNRTSMLWQQYRMHPDIMSCINQFYDDKLECGWEPAKQRQERAHGLKGSSWLRADCHAYWLDLPRDKKTLSQGHPSKFNDYEVSGIAERVLPEIWDAMHAAGQDFNIGVISFYAAQVEKLRSAINTACQRRGIANTVRVSSVDRFQGMERDIIVVSMVFSQADKHKLPTPFLQSPERINVALSRARRLLVIVGSAFSYTMTKFDAAPKYRNVWEHIKRIDGCASMRGDDGR